MSVFATNLAPSLYGGHDSLSDSPSGMSARSLSDVPEEGPFSPTSPNPNSPYYTPSAEAASSSTTLNVPNASSPRISSRSGSSRKSSSKTMGRSSSDGLSTRRTASSSSGSTMTATKDGKSSRIASTSLSRIRSTPRLPHDKEVEAAPATAMYWSRAPVYGAIPNRTMRGHSVTVVDSIAWVFGGCDDSKETSKEMYCFDVETMQWSHPETVGDLPPPSRAHTATLVDRKIVIYGGGQGTTYYDTVYIFDTVLRRWSHPVITGEIPPPRRAHTAVLYQGKIWVFGGGNGMTALNDVWCLDMSPKIKWTRIKTRGTPPSVRGYHTANLVGPMMVIVGGSDGKDCFSEIWILNLDTLVWRSLVLTPEYYKRLSHSSTQVGSYLFIQGGHDGEDYVSTMHFFNLVSLQYESRIVYGKPPSPRGYHVSILADSRLFFFGGYNGAVAFDDVYIIDLAASAYLPQVTSFTIELPP
ncbi:galactose oxidase [Mycena floridula]|nr:galactose oxidase [Mycena floridula]